MNRSNELTSVMHGRSTFVEIACIQCLNTTVRGYSNVIGAEPCCSRARRALVRSATAEGASTDAGPSRCLLCGRSLL